MSATDGFELTARPARTRELLRSVWEARELVGILARKDFYVRYRRATFGLLWAAALPLLQALVLAFVISRFARFDTGDDYVVFVLAGTVAWSAVSSTITVGSTAVVDGAGLSTKIYFPRIVFPLVTVMTGAYGLLISVVVLVVACVVSGVGLGIELVLLVPAVLLSLALAAAFSVLLSALHVYFRDVRYLVQAGMLVWIYLTPVFYPLSAIGDAERFVIVNPMTGVVSLYRAATVGAESGWLASVGWSVGWVAVLALAGWSLHRLFDRVFADLL